MIALEAAETAGSNQRHQVGMRELTADNELSISERADREFEKLGDDGLLLAGERAGDRAARETTAICIFAGSGCGNAPPAPIRRPCRGPTLEAKRCEGRLNPCMINQSNLGGVSGL